LRNIVLRQVLHAELGSRSSWLKLNIISKVTPINSYPSGFHFGVRHEDLFVADCAARTRPVTGVPDHWAEMLLAVARIRPF
jgi:hypothetical protein